MKTKRVKMKGSHMIMDSQMGKFRSRVLFFLNVIPDSRHDEGNH